MLLKKHDVRNEPETKVLDQLENAFNFTDGNIRSQYYWHEIYNTPDYYQDIGFVNRVMLNGVGGEQYRNGEWINRSTSNFDTWIKNAVLFFQAGNPFRRSSEFSDFFAWYMEKIRRKLNIHSTRVNHLQIKRFLNEIYNPSLRTLRSNNENQLMFHLSPFTDWVVSSFAYRAVPFLGRSKEFQIRMIRRLNPEIASIRSSYGYPFSDDEPLKDLIFSGFFNLFPKNLLSTVGRIRSGGRICEWEKIPLLSSMADNFCQTLTEMSPALNTKYIRSNSALSPLLFQMEYFIRKMPNL